MQRELSFGSTGQGRTVVDREKLNVKSEPIADGEQGAHCKKIGISHSVSVIYVRNFFSNLGSEQILVTYV